MAKKSKIGITMGGASSEYEVSLASGENVYDSFQKSQFKDRFDVFKIKILKNGRVQFNGRFTSLEKAVKSVDFCFLATHGEFGEDGKLQAILELYNIPYSGSDSLASALAMNKEKSRKLFEAYGLTVPRNILLKREENFDAQLNFFIDKVVKFPLVVKPCSRGSSVGVSIITRKNFLKRAIDKAFTCDNQILIEEYIDGREFSCGVIQADFKKFKKVKNDFILRSNGLIALPVTEIIPKPKYKFFNYDAKYKPGAADEITPAQINGELFKRIQEEAIKAHKIIGCQDYSRSDFLVKNGKIYILELNTLPGLTKNSLIPKQLKAAGISFEEFLESVIKI